MNHKTQCPFCSNIYRISDEQISLANGSVRCGSCMQRFTLKLLDSDTKIEPQLDAETHTDNSSFRDKTNSNSRIEPSFTGNHKQRNAPDLKLNNQQHEESENKKNIEVLDEGKPNNNDDFIFNIQEQDSQDHIAKKPFLVRFLNFVVCLSLYFAGLLLIGLLIYQLWLKQIISWPDSPLLKPAIEKSINTFGLQLAVRTNVAKLKLVSSQTLPHPNDTRLILLKVSVLNRASIAQPFPSLQLTLTDKNGNIVSRRSLKPKDYLFNNKTDNLIAQNEQKNISIELKKFPSNAQGFEVALLEKDS